MILFPATFLASGTRHSRSMVSLHELQTALPGRHLTRGASASSGPHSSPVPGRGTKLGIYTQNTSRLNEGSEDCVRRGAPLCGIVGLD